MTKYKVIATRSVGNGRAAGYYVDSIYGNTYLTCKIDTGASITMISMAALYDFAFDGFANDESLQWFEKIAFGALIDYAKMRGN